MISKPIITTFLEYWFGLDKKSTFYFEEIGLVWVNLVTYPEDLKTFLNLLTTFYILNCLLTKYTLKNKF